MLDAPILPAVMAEMLYDRGLSPADLAEDQNLHAWMGRVLQAWRVRPCCAPTDLRAVRADLERLCRGERPAGVAA